MKSNEAKAAQLLPAYLNGELDEAAREEFEAARAKSSKLDQLVLGLQADEQAIRQDRQTLQALYPPSQATIHTMLGEWQGRQRRQQTRRLVLNGLGVVMALATVLVMISLFTVSSQLSQSSSGVQIGDGSGPDRPIPVTLISTLPTPTDTALNSPAAIKTPKITYREDLKLIWPVHGIIITEFGQQLYSGFSTGLDIATTIGTPILAADNGLVTTAGWEEHYGLTVVIQHAYGYSTRYAHLNKLDVKTNQQVKQGTQIGTLGSTGDATGGHLHFEVIEYGTYLDPQKFLPRN